MNTRLLMIAIAAETDIVLVRKRTRRLAELIGFDTQDQTRITTAVSEIARNAFEYAHGGQIEFRLAGDKGPQKLVIGVRDRGPGIAKLEAILAGYHKSTTGMGVGLLGAQRLMDGFRIDTKPGEGTTVWLEKWLPTRSRLTTPSSIKALAEALAADGPADAMAEIRQQNQQILIQMGELRSRHEELERLNQELQDTNRGVVALYAELDERADHLRRADELKSKFLSHMSHEFRTPLNSIMALSRLLLDRVDGELTTEQETQVRYIRKAAENLTELVDDLLDLAKVEAGKTVVVASEFTAGSLFGALRGMLRPLLVGDAVALVFDDASDVPPLDTDEAKVSQILRNFISNAIKFTERGQVRVWATSDNVADTVAFHVRDTGIGIAATDLELIFQEFGQVSHRLQSRVKGTGLGLPLARKLAELLGGRITVSSTPGEGSTFSVTLPRSYPNSVGPADDAGEVWHLEPGKIPVLLVEDDPADAFTMERLLAGTDYQPVWARSIRQAQGILRRVEPAAILLDVILAGDESWRLMLQLKQQEASADIPLIVTSSAGEQHKARHLGADEYLPKPVDGRLLIELLDRVTGRQPTTKVLLIDDEDVTRYLVRQLLPRSGYSLCCANNGREGIRLLHDQHPDVVLLDLKMPEMDGYEYLEQVHDNATGAGLQLPNAPIIVLTSTVLDPGERTLLKRRAVTVLPKSELSPDTLVGTIEGVLRNSRPVVAR
jgi:signal transduction histidine kinase/CheY-like chemotaxis protein